MVWSYEKTGNEDESDLLFPVFFIMFYHHPFTIPVDGDILVKKGDGKGGGIRKNHNQYERRRFGES